MVVCPTNGRLVEFAVVRVHQSSIFHPLVVFYEAVTNYLHFRLMWYRLQIRMED